MARPTFDSIINDPHRIKRELWKLATKKDLKREDSIRVTALRTILGTLGEQESETDEAFLKSLKETLMATDDKKENDDGK